MQNGTQVEVLRRSAFCRRKAMENIPEAVKKMMEEGTMLMLNKK